MFKILIGTCVLLVLFGLWAGLTAAFESGLAAFMVIMGVPAFFMITYAIGDAITGDHVGHD
jgi:uncharacterized membrane protein YccF (DUF307 family)